MLLTIFAHSGEVGDTPASEPVRAAEDSDLEAAAVRLLDDHPDAQADARHFEKAYARPAKKLERLDVRAGDLRAVTIPMRATNSITGVRIKAIEASAPKAAVHDLYRLVPISTPRMELASDGAPVAEGTVEAVLLVAFDVAPGKHPCQLELQLDYRFEGGGVTVNSSEKLGAPAELRVKKARKADDSAMARDLARTYRTLDEVLEEIEELTVLVFEKGRARKREDLAELATLANVLCVRLGMHCARAGEEQKAALGLRERIRGRVADRMRMAQLVREDVVPLTCFPKKEG